MPITFSAPYKVQNGEPILITGWDATHDNGGKKFKRKIVIKKLQRKLEKLKNEAKETNTKIRIQTILKMGKNQWRNSQTHDVEDGVVPMYMPDVDYDGAGYVEDTGKYEAFKLVVIREPLGGGCSSNSKGNHCFYLCLQKLLDKDMMIKVFGTPYDFKDWLGIGKEDLVQIKHMESIERLFEKKRIKINLYVSGDEMYVSRGLRRLEAGKPAVQYARRIDLILKDNHFTINDEPEGFTRQKVRGGTREEKPLVVYEIKGDDVECYTETDGGKQNSFVMTLEQKRQDREKPESAKYNYLPFKATSKCPTMKDFYNEMKKNNEELVKATDGKINFISANGIRNAAIKFYRSKNKTVLFQPITQNEQEWIMAASIGSMMWGKKEYRGYGRVYDFVSCYPSIMKNQHFLLPYRQGEFHRIKELKTEHIPYGIYRVRGLSPPKTPLSSSNVPPTQDGVPLFRQNPKNYYTHFDLQYARDELGYEITLVQDDKPNCLTYTRDKLVCGSEVFGKTIDYLFDLKKKGVGGAKLLINILWGGLCKYRTTEVRATQKHPREIFDIRELEGLKMPTDETYIAKLLPKSAAFECAEARMKPFLLAYGRRKINRRMKPIAKHIVRVHTDGFIVDSPDVDVGELGDDIGDLKIEKEADEIYVKNCIEIDWGAA